MEPSEIAAIMNAVGSNGAPMDIMSVIKVIDAYENLKKSKQRLKIKFTDNVFGEAAKQWRLPAYAHFGEDAGMDLPIMLAPEDRDEGHTIHPGERVCLHTGIIIEPPHNYWGFIIHRSSTERKKRMRIVEGVIDWGYRDEVLVQVHNPNSYPMVIKHGQRLAQLILLPLAAFPVEVMEELSHSSRGRGGFGSSGM